RQTALSQITENRKVETCKSLIFRNTLLRFCLKKANLRQNSHAPREHHDPCKTNLQGSRQKCLEVSTSRGRRCVAGMGSGGTGGGAWGDAVSRAHRAQWGLCVSPSNGLGSLERWRRGRTSVRGCSRSRSRSLGQA